MFSKLESFLENKENLTKTLFYKGLNLLGVLLLKIIKSIPSLVLYAFMSFIYLSIYYSVGFEQTLIILLVGVIVFAIRKNKG